MGLEYNQFQINQERHKQNFRTYYNTGILDDNFKYLIEDFAVSVASLDEMKAERNESDKNSRVFFLFGGDMSVFLLLTAKKRITTIYRNRFTDVVEIIL